MAGLTEKTETKHIEGLGVVDIHTNEPDSNTPTSPVEFDDVDLKKILWKMDIRIIPVVTVLYLLSFLDRGNIGNAKIQNMTQELNLTGNQYNICLTVFFFTYCAFEIPSNLLLKRLRPSVWLPCIMVAWGTCTVCLGVVNNYEGLLICRIFLGVAEAGLYPGVAYYLTMWYEPRYLTLRQGMFFSAASLAGAFSGLLAYAIAKMDGIGHYSGWRWIFILEGLLTVAVAFFAFFLMYDFPETAKFLTEAERRFVVHRLAFHGSDKSSKMVAESDKFQWKYVYRAITDWKIYLSLLMYWGISCPLYGISFFLPTIILELGYTSTNAQLLTIPIYVSAAGLTVLVAYVADRTGMRSTLVAGGQSIMLIGFIMTIAGSAHGGVPGVVYAGVFIATSAIYPAFVINITWVANNLAPSYKRAAGMALQIGLGNLGGAMASNFYRSQDSPKFILGHAIELGFIALGLCATISLRLIFGHLNKLHERQEAAGLDMTEEELSDLGDRAPTFRFRL